MILQIYIVFVGFMKFLFFIRIYDQMGFLVQMVGNTMIQLIPFIAFFFLWVLFFATLQGILQVGVGEDYDGLAMYFSYIFMTYRNSIGDITTPTHPYLDNLDETQSVKNLMIGLIWSIWLVNQVLNLIILLNFLIAVIS